MNRIKDKLILKLSEIEGSINYAIILTDKIRSSLSQLSSDVCLEQIVIYDKETLSIALKETRKDRGVKQKDLAKLVGISKATISALEVGRNSNVGVLTVLKIISVYGMGIKFVKLKSEGGV